MIIFLGIVTCITMLVSHWTTRRLSRENASLRRQRDTAYDFLRAAENYSHKLETEQYEIRKIVNARNGERTSEAVRKWTTGRRIWS